MARPATIWFLLLCLIVPLFAQENQTANKLDLLIQEMQIIVRRLEKKEIDEIQNELERLKQNIQLAREIKLLVVQSQQVVESRGSELAERLKEDTRALYNRLREIPLVRRSDEWGRLETTWLNLQSRAIENISEGEMPLYQQQLKNLDEGLRSLEANCEKQYSKMLQDTYQLYLDAVQDSWVHQFSRWKMVQSSWEKSWEKREEKGLAGSAHFEEMYLALVDLTGKAREQKNKAHKSFTAVYAEVQSLYNLLAKMSFVTRQEKWIAYEQKWRELRDTDLQSISPQDTRKLELELIALRTSLLSYQVELQQLVIRIYQGAQTIYGKIRLDPWAQAVSTYGKTIALWDETWQARLDIPISQISELEAMRDALEYIHKQAQDAYKESQNKVSVCKQSIEKWTALLEPNPLVKRQSRWFDMQSQWQELQYFRSEGATPAACAKHYERLSEIQTTLQQLHAIAQKEMNELAHKTQSLYQQLANSAWVASAQSWAEIDKEWHTQWEWKKDIAPSDIAGLESILQKMQVVQSMVQQQRDYMLKETRQQYLELKKMFEAIGPIGDKHASWTEIKQIWNGMQAAQLDTMSPDKMQEHFNRGKELRLLLEKAHQDLRRYCLELLSKTNNIYEMCVKEPWTQQSDKWSEISQQWLYVRPLRDEDVTAEQGPSIETFCKQLTQLYGEVQKEKEKKMGEVEKLLTHLVINHDRLNNKTFLLPNQAAWLVWKSDLDKLMQQDYRHITPADFALYEQQLMRLGQAYPLLQEEAENNLHSLWNKTRKLQETIKQNPWTMHLYKKSHTERVWENLWASKQKAGLEDSEALVQMKEQLERCWPFWWRPLPPAKEMPAGFLLDMHQIDCQGEPSLPQWSQDGGVLCFQAAQNEQLALQFFDLVSGHNKTVELYDPKKRWVAFPNWAPRPHSSLLAFSGKKMGFYDIYQLQYSRSQLPEPQAVTDSLEYDRQPRWCVVADKLCLFFLRDNDLYYVSKGKEHCLLKASALQIAELRDFAVYGDSQSLKVALCVAEKAGEHNSDVWYATAVWEQNSWKVANARKASEMAGHHFAPVWNKDGQWLVSYLEQENGKMNIARIYPETGREKLLSGNASVLMPAGAEIRAKGPELFGSPEYVLYLANTKDDKWPVLTMTSVDNLTHDWQFNDPACQALFHETDHISLSPDRNFLAWTYVKPGQGRKLAIAVVQLPSFGER